MSRKRCTKRRRRVSSGGRHPLIEIKRLKHRLKYLINPNALESARQGFGWLKQDIVDALNKLQNKHYIKTVSSNHKPGVMIDMYQAFGLKGENIYTHFYVDPDSGKLIINSFKRNRKKR